MGNPATRCRVALKTAGSGPHQRLPDPESAGHPPFGRWRFGVLSEPPEVRKTSQGLARAFAWRSLHRRDLTSRACVVEGAQSARPRAREFTFPSSVGRGSIKGRVSARSDKYGFCQPGAEGGTGPAPRVRRDPGLLQRGRGCRQRSREELPAIPGIRSGSDLLRRAPRTWCSTRARAGASPPTLASCRCRRRSGPDRGGRERGSSRSRRGRGGRPG